MRRSETNKSTLSIVAKNLNKYNRWLGVINVIILLSGLCMVFFGSVLHLHYEMDSLAFISEYFNWLPILMLSVGSAAFLTGIAGFVCLAMESKPAIIIYGLMMAILCPGMIANVIASFGAKAVISANLEGHTGVNFHKYFSDPDFKDRWDQLQRRVRCCGAEHFGDFSGFYDRLGKQCYPDSCCVDDNCGIIKDHEDGHEHCDDYLKHRGKIYSVGCLRILKWMYKQELDMGTLIFAIAVAFVAIFAAIGSALSFAYFGHLSRRAKKWDVAQGCRDTNTLGMATFNES